MESPKPTHPSIIRLFFTLFAAIFRILREAASTKRIVAESAEANQDEEIAREQVESLERSLPRAKEDHKRKIAVAKDREAKAAEADRKIRDRVAIVKGDLV